MWEFQRAVGMEKRYIQGRRSGILAKEAQKGRRSRKKKRGGGKGYRRRETVLFG